MSNKKETGDFFRNIVKVLEKRLYQLEMDKIKYGKFKRFVKGIDKNIILTENRISHYLSLISRYEKEGWIE